MLSLKLPQVHTPNGFNYGASKQLISTYNIIGDGKYTNKPICLATVRFYTNNTNDNAVFCSLWVFGKPYDISGHGHTREVVTDRQFLTFNLALRSAGIECSRQVSIFEGLSLIAEELGYDRTTTLILTN